MVVVIGGKKPSRKEKCEDKTREILAFTDSHALIHKNTGYQSIYRCIDSYNDSVRINKLPFESQKPPVLLLFVCLFFVSFLFCVQNKGSLLLPVLWSRCCGVPSMEC